MIGGNAPRQAIQAEIGDWLLTCLKNPQPGTKCRLQISLDGAAAEPDLVFDSLDSMISAMRLDHAGQAQFLRLVLMQVLPTFGLMADEKLAKAFGESLGRAPFLAGSATLCVVAGQSCPGLVLPAGCTIAAGDTALLIGSTCQFGRLIALEEWIGMDAGKVLEAVLTLDSPPVDARLLVVIKPRALICLSLSWNEFEDFGRLAAQFTRHASALPSLMALHAPPEILADMNSAIIRSQACAQAVQAVQAGACEFALSIGVMIWLPAGIFVSGWMHDPNHCLAAIHVLDHSLRDPDLGRQWLTHRALMEVRGSARPVTGFCGFVRRTDNAGWLHQTPLLVRLVNGEHHVVLADCGLLDLLGQRSALLGAVTPAALAGGGFAEVFGPAMAGLQDVIAPRSRLRGIRRFGKPSWRRTSIIIPLYRQLGFLRSQLLAFAVNAIVREQCEIIYVLDDPAPEGAVATILGGFAQFVELDLALAVMSENGGYARANNLGVEIANGAFLVLMNSDAPLLRPVAFRLHGLLSRSPAADFTMRALDVRRALSLVDQLVAPSLFLKTKFETHLADCPPITFVENGFVGRGASRHPSAFLPAPPRCEGHTVFGYFGKISAVKGLADLLEAAERLDRRGCSEFPSMSISMSISMGRNCSRI